jgi:hypothetical protein
VRSLEIAALLFFALLGMARLVGWDWATEHAVAVSFAGLGLFSLGGAALGRPWTAEYARADYGDVAETREFIINSTITGHPGCHLPFLCALSALVAGGVGACGGRGRRRVRVHPGTEDVVRLILSRKLGRRERYDWPAPAIGGARGDGAYDVAVVGAGVGA